MSKAIIIAVFGTLLIVCIGVQVISTYDETETEADKTVTQNYYLSH